MLLEWRYRRSTYYYDCQFANNIPYGFIVYFYVCVVYLENAVAQFSV